MKRPILFLLVLGTLFAFGFSWRDIQRGELPPPRSLNALLGVKTSASEMSPEQVFRENYNRILANYVREIKPVDLKYAGMEGMLASLGDPHTMFLSPRAAKAFADDTRANFFGVGARLSPDPLGASVGSVFEDGPAHAAGLRAGNVIIGVDGVSMSGREIDNIVDRIKGPEGTVVKLEVIQEGKDKPVTLTIRRARIIAPTVESKMMEGTSIGYLNISSFSEPTAAQFDRELAKLEGQGMRGLVIDVRNNPGGLLETSVDLLSRFVSNKVVVKMKFRDGQEEVARTYSGGVREFRYPIVVLMNEESASAAEIFAGCLKDYGKATLVGDHTYGKASVQNVFPLVDHSSAKITIAKYYLPFSGFIGRKVDDDGIYVSGGLQPDVAVKWDIDNDSEFGNPEKDSQLAKAIQVVKGKL
jgi:carboxyl-terminal processing protease